MAEISDPGRTPLVFSSKGSATPKAGGFESFDPEHAGRGTIAFVDGSAGLFDRQAAGQLIWDAK